MVYGVGNGNNINRTTFRSLVNPKGIEKPNSQPINLTSAGKTEAKQIERTDLDKLNQVDRSTIEFKAIADDTNKILASYGLKTKVTPAQVASVQNIYNQEAAPALARAVDNSTEARIANPNGPFAELLSETA